MKKKLTALLAVLALSLSLAPAALAAGEAEPNNDYTTATSIRVNETVNGSFTPSGRNGDSDWYKFTLDEPGRVVFSFEAPSRIYFTGSLRCADEKGDLKEIYHDYFNGLPNAVSDTISHEAVPLFLDKGTYYLCLYADSAYEGAYTLQAGCTPLSAGSLEYEPNNDYTKATPIDLNTVVSGSFTPIRDNDENDWYRFTMPAPGRLDLSVTALSGVSFSLHLNGINEKGALEQVYQQTFSGSHNSTTATVNHTAESVYLSAGTYYLQFWADSSYEGAYTFQAASDAAPKPDVPSSWAAEEVSAAIDAGLVPDSLRKNYTGTVTRSQVAGMFILLLEKSSGRDIEALMDRKGVEIDPAAFTDTSDPDVLAANALGIINGIGGGKFAPNGTFTRAQIAAILNRVATVLDVDTGGYTHSFTDMAGHWASSELGWPVHAGIIKGVGGTRFDPDGILTTEQVILMVYRAWEAL